MRASTAAAIFCLAAAVAPSVADTSTKAKNTPRVVKEAPVVNEVHKTIGYELLKGAVTALVGTGILTTFDIFGKTPSRRELLERFNERVNQELTAREYKREPLTTSLDDLD